MTVQSITLNLTEIVMWRARQAADILQHPLEEVLASMLTATLPNVEDAPSYMRADLARMTWLSEQDLWAIARGTSSLEGSAMSEEQQQQLQRLIELQTQRPLTEEEQRTLEALRQEYGRVTLRKARAYALLSLRGGRPLLADN